MTATDLLIPASVAVVWLSGARRARRRGERQVVECNGWWYVIDSATRVALSSGFKRRREAVSEARRRRAAVSSWDCHCEDAIRVARPTRGDW